MESENGTGYSDYKTPGGENYREILLKLPSSRPSASNYKDPAKYDADMRAFNASGKSDYQSSHWKEDPNVLAHMRVQDRTGPNGEKILHVEEIQSDWHQEGRKRGYASEDKPIRLSGEVIPLGDKTYGVKWQDGSVSDVGLGFDHAQRLADKGKLTGVVPDAPFKKNWHELAMKRLLNYAADNGYDSIAITPGMEQAKRYDLSQQISKVDYNKFNSGQNELTAWDKNGKKVFEKYGASQEEVADYIGKEAAEKLFATTPKDNHMGGERYSLIGEELQVGGEGMKGFYDQILPSYLNTFGKPYGAQVGSQTIDVPKMINVGSGAQTEVGRLQIPLHNFPITPEMRQQIQQKGLPLYQQIAIPTAGAGAASQIPEEEEGMSGGGSVAKMAALAKLAKLREEMAPRAEAVKALIAKDENKYLRDVAPNSLTNAEIEAEIARMKARAEASQPEVKKADGGAINFDTAPDMSDGGRIIQGAPFKRGGKVNMTANRDTMFLELSNKKLKRK
jgi:hypothetical protein